MVIIQYGTEIEAQLDNMFTPVSSGKKWEGLLSRFTRHQDTVELRFQSNFIVPVDVWTHHEDILDPQHDVRSKRVFFHQITSVRGSTSSLINGNAFCVAPMISLH